MTSTAQQHHHSTGKLLFYTLGIFLCYSYYAILQERITRGVYTDNGNDEKFTFMITLVFIACVVNYIFAKILLLTVMKQGEDSTDTCYYATCALTYLLGMVCGNMALQFVDYPTQVVAKAGKPIPIMIFGLLLSRKSYALKKYLFVGMVVAGVMMFMYKDKVAAKQYDREGFGQILLLLALVMDGLTSVVQDRMGSEHKTKSGHMMLNMNLWSVVFTGTVILLTGELMSFYEFIHRHPAALQHIAMFSLCGAFGQYFIFLTVTEFGPLACSIATTTRKCFTVLASVLFFGNAMLFRQWIATAIVFLGLFLDIVYGKSSASVKKDVAK